jgi:hypothetical protein
VVSPRRETRSREKVKRAMPEHLVARAMMSEWPQGPLVLSGDFLAINPLFYIHF